MSCRQVYRDRVWNPKSAVRLSADGAHPSSKGNRGSDSGDLITVSPLARQHSCGVTS